MLEIRHLTKQYGEKTAVDDLTLTIGRERSSASSGRMGRARPPP